MKGLTVVNKVSIPWWYNSELHTQGRRYIAHRFQCLGGTIQRRYFLQCCRPMSGFNSLVVQFRVTSGTKRRLRYKVSIPWWYNSEFIEVPHKLPDPGFNSLVVQFRA